MNKTVSKNIPENIETKQQKDKIKGDNLIETGQVGEKLPVKKQQINALVEHQKNKSSPGYSNLERMTPNKPDQLNKRPAQNNKVSEATPKLVIGKIIVEILPPKLQVPQKVISRVVQSSSKDSFPKSNKLIFGLGQL